MMKTKKETKYIPSPEEIQVSCDMIQQRWTVNDTEKRRVIKTKGWTPPIIDLPNELAYLDEPFDMM